MKATKILTMRLTMDEYRYALALSKHSGTCVRKTVGSHAHGLKWALHQMAKIERVPLNAALADVYTSAND